MPRPAPTLPRPRLARRPLLDGLRGVFVGLTMLFHLTTTGPHLPGGWVGVSGFFVLSGFLITRLLLAEEATTDRLDLLAFYGRRARRLAPALLATVALTVPAATAAGVVLEPARLRGDALAALTYVANWRFVLDGQAYGATFAPSPLRHTWSLAIEEQFYLVWPLLLLGLVRLVGRRRALLPLVAGAATSAWWAGHLAAGGAAVTRVYDGTDTRAQELLVGATVAVLLLRLGPPGHGPGDAARRRQAATFAGLAGLVLLAVAAVSVHLDDPTTYTRGRLLAVAVAAGLVVGGAALTDTGPLRRLLGGRALRALGVRAYALYLVHWPVVVLLTPERTGRPALVVDGARVVAALALAEVLHRAVEQPFLEGRVRLPRPAVALASATVLVAALVVAVGLAPGDRAEVAAPLTAEPEVVALPPPPPPVDGFAPPPRVVVLGDSQAFVLLRNALRDPAIRVGGSHHGGCDVVGQVIASAGNVLAEVPDCPAWPDEWGRALADGADVVIVSLGLRHVFDPVLDGERAPVGSPRWEAAYREGIGRAVDVIRAHTDAPVVWLDVPCSRWYFDRDRSGTDPERLATVNRVLADELHRHRDVLVAPYGARLCGPDAQPRTELLLDGVHLTDAAAADTWTWLREIVVAATGTAPAGPATAAVSGLRADLVAAAGLAR